MIDETDQLTYEQELAERAKMIRMLRTRGIRRWMIGLPEIGNSGRNIIEKRLGKLFIPLCYGMKHSARTRRKPVNVDEHVEKWFTAIRGLVLSHTREELQKHDFGLDEILRPMLRAPLKQLKELYAKLLQKMKEDPEIPYFVWTSLETYGESFLVGAPDDGVVKLKAGLARQIARMVEADVEPQLSTAIVNALKWRDPENLEELRDVLKTEQGKPASKRQKASLVGRQSCLFLKVGKKEIML